MAPSPRLLPRAWVLRPRLSAIPEQRYERLLLRDGQPRNQSWDGRWICELQPACGTRMTITEHGWTDGFLFFIQ